VRPSVLFSNVTNVSVPRCCAPRSRPGRSLKPRHRLRRPAQPCTGPPGPAASPALLSVLSPAHAPSANSSNASWVPLGHPPRAPVPSCTYVPGRAGSPQLGTLAARLQRPLTARTELSAGSFPSAPVLGDQGINLRGASGKGIITTPLLQSQLKAR